jgi:small subunit ribosomal protein S16
MATRIRLRRIGRKKQPEYRVVVAESTAGRDGRFVAIIGHYNPRSEPVSVRVDVAQAREWLAKGATPSATVRSLLKKAGVFDESTPATPATAEAAPEASEPAPEASEPAAE